MYIQNLNNNENESDQDEGFVPSKMTIRERKQLDNRVNSRALGQKRQFISRYITEECRKQPIQCYSRFSTFDYIDKQLNSKSSSIQQKQFIQRMVKLSDYENSQQIDYLRQQKNKLMTPYQKYVESGEYKLVYCRYKGSKFVKDKFNFASNDLKLDCLRSRQQVNFKPIKSFQIITEKSQSTFTHSINNSTLIRQSILQFDSKFQSGNLLCAYKHKHQPYTYSLFIQNNTNSNGYNQWFYFSIRQVEINIPYRFYIVNFRKRQSFFKEGNRPVVFSLKDSRKEGMSGYSKRGDNVQYGRSGIVKSHQSKQRFYQLYFQLQFHNENDLIYISMGMPFSYSKLIHSLSSYEQIAQRNSIKFQFQSIGTSIAGNLIPYLTITGKQNPQGENNIDKDELDSGRKEMIIDERRQKQIACQKGERMVSQQSSPLIKNHRKKRVIFLMGRQHPGQTWSSYLIDEFIYSLISLSIPQCNYLLSHFIFKIIPMINVDGVISGNFRCDLSGMDLNRNWKNPSSILHPQIVSIKNQINLIIHQGYKIQACFDLHGHSKQYNIFCYSCKIDNEECRLLPYILSNFNEEFHFPFCTFGISKYKQSTARAVIFGIIKNTNVLTLESSFFGSKLNEKVSVFETLNFNRMAKTLLQGCKSYFSQDQNYENCKKIVKQRLDQFMEYKNQKQDALSGSDSQPQVDQIDLTQKLEKIVPKNLVQECIIEQKLTKKPVKKTKKSLKRKTYIGSEDKFSKQKKQSYNSLNKNLTIDVVSQSPVKQTTKSNWQPVNIRNKRPIQTRPSHFKKASIMISHEQVDQLNRQVIDPIPSNEQNKQKKSYRQIGTRTQQKYSFFSKQKSYVIPLRKKNDSFEIFRQAYNVTQKYLKNTDQPSIIDQIPNPTGTSSRKLGILRDFRDKQFQQFPLLCVLSDTKKKNQVEKIKQRRASQNSNLSSAKEQKLPQKVKTPIQTRTEAIRKLREKEKNSMELVSKIWRENFTRYGMAYSTFKISK